VRLVVAYANRLACRACRRLARRRRRWIAAGRRVLFVRGGP
jgi:hypothetical protein